jgi:23S rRNA pseudouridine2605 synthase
MTEASVPKEGERIAKRLSRAGVCSRRDAEKLIAEGRVTLNGTVLTTPATLVTDSDAIVVDGKLVCGIEPARLFRYHKPHGLVTTRRDEKGRQTIFDQMPAGLPRLISIGRLDLTSEGLMLLTNDGELSRQLELPSTAWVRRYRVRAFGRLDMRALERLKNGVTVEGVRYGPIVATFESAQGANSWLTVELQEGRNREIRRVFEHMDLTVNRLIRVAYGPFQLGKLPEGAVEEVPTRIVKEEMAGLQKRG